MPDTTSTQTPTPTIAPVEPTVADHSAGAEIVKRPLDTLMPSPLNPRKDFDADRIAELGESILRNGLLAPIVVRALKKPKGAVTHEIVAGERRFRATRSIGWTAIDTIEKAVTDADMLRLALIENVQRADIAPMEEARAYKTLVEAHKETTETLAASIGKTRRHVQLRLALAEKLDPAVQRGLDAGTVTLAQARVLTQAEKKEQRAMLEEITIQAQNGYEPITAEDLKETLFGDKPPVGRNIFALDAYAAAGGTIVEDVDDPEIKYFDNPAIFARLQHAAALDKKAELEKTRAWVELVPPDEPYHSWTYRPAPAKQDKAKTGAVIEMRCDGAVVVHDGLAKPSTGDNAAKAAPARKSADKKQPAAPTPESVVTKAHLFEAHRQKSKALQTAIAEDADVALRVVCLALMGGGANVHIRAKHHEREDNAPAAAVMTRLRFFAERFKPVAVVSMDSDDRPDPGHPIEIRGYSWDCRKRDTDELTLYKALEALEPEVLDDLFAALIAARCGTFSGYSPDFGDTPLACYLAERLEIDTSGCAKDPAALEGVRKPALLALARRGEDLDAAALEAKPAAAVRSAVLAAGLTATLPTLRFGSNTAVTAELKAMLAPKPKTETAATSRTAAAAPKAKKKPATSKKPKKKTAPKPKKKAPKKRPA